MEGGAGAGAVASLTLDCEDMFKEITKKLYGEEAGAGGVEFPAADRDADDDARPEEHITAWGLAALMQNGFPPPGILQANFAPRTDPTHEDRWTAAEEPLAWAHSRVAAYNPAQRLFKCADCECVGFLARVAEHWLGTHSQVGRSSRAAPPRAAASHPPRVAGARLPVPGGRVRVRVGLGALGAHAPRPRPPLRPRRRRPPAARQPRARRPHALPAAAQN